jgi:probable F420-dependent oxidoreductase
MKVAGGGGEGGAEERGWPGSAAASARRAEELGYDVISASETSHDSIVRATLMLQATERIEVSTSVTIAFPRSPYVLALEAWDLQHLGKGRFAIGLGSQVRGHNERRFGVPWIPGPATRMKDYVRMMRAVWDTFQSDTRPNFQGKFYQFTLMSPFFNPGPIEFPQPRVLMAVVGDGMARAAGEVADGVLPHGFMTDRYMREVVLPNIGIGLKRSKRDWSDIEISAGGYVVFGENQSEIEQNIERLRTPISFYGSTRTYHEVFDPHGLRDLGEQLYSLSLEGKWQEMPRVIPEAALWEMAQTSTYDEAPEFFRTKREYASRVSFSMPMRTPGDRERFDHILAQIKAIRPVAPRGL